MVTIEQVAMRTDNIGAQLEQFHALGLNQWVRDTVEAVHIWKHPNLDARLGERFRVHLAFNYEFIPGTEFEVLQLLTGVTAQFAFDDAAAVNRRMSHYGYHTKHDQAGVDVKDSLLEELQLLESAGLSVLQVSQTVAHTNTQRRYRYAFVTGGMTGGMPLKIIQRLLPHRSLGDQADSLVQGKKLFACLSN